MTVPHRPLGSTGIDVSCLGLGTVKFGRNQGVKYPKDFSLPKDTKILQLLESAQEMGINLIDTAPAYGSSEERLGQLLRERDKWIIATKVGEEFVNGESAFNFSGEHTRLSVERSLRHLNTDYLDLVLIHSDGNDLEVINSTSCLETLHKLKDKGLIRALGMSTKTVAGGRRTVELMDAVMVTYNAEHRDEEQVIDYANELGKAVLIKKALASGHARDSKQALQFALQKQGVSSAIVGTLSIEHLAANAKAASQA